MTSPIYTSQIFDRLHQYYTSQILDSALSPFFPQGFRVFIEASPGIDALQNYFYCIPYYKIFGTLGVDGTSEVDVFGEDLEVPIQMRAYGS